MSGFDWMRYLKCRTAYDVDRDVEWLRFEIGVVDRQFCGVHQMEAGTERGDSEDVVRGKIEEYAREKGVEIVDGNVWTPK